MHNRIETYMDGGPSWNVADVEMPEAPGMTFPLYYRCPISCAKALLANPTFEEHIDYAPDEVFAENGSRVYHEMVSGDIWNELQVSIS